MQGLYRDMCRFGGLVEKEMFHLSQSWQNMWRDDVTPEKKKPTLTMIETILTEDVELADMLAALGDAREEERNRTVSKIQKKSQSFSTI